MSTSQVIRRCLRGTRAIVARAGNVKSRRARRRNLPGRRAFPRSTAHPLPVKPMDLRRVARVLHPRVLPASRERNYLIITLNARLRPRESIYRRRGNDLYQSGVREGPEDGDDEDDDDGIYYGLVCVFKRQSPSPVRTTAIWSAGVAIDYR